MASSQPATTGYSRRLKFLAAGIVALIAAYSGAWYWIAGRIEAEIANGVGVAQQRGQSLTCENTDVRGYPFRLGVFCDAVAARLPAEGITLSAGAFRSAAQVYRPSHVVAEIDGPAFVDIPDFRPLRFDWELLRASMVHDSGRAERISVEGRKMALGLREAADGAIPLASLDRGETHLRLRGEALDLASSGDGLASSEPRFAGMPKVSYRLEASLPAGAVLVRGEMADPAHPMRGQAVDIAELSLSVPDSQASVSLKGNIRIDEAGLANGAVDVRFVKPEIFGEAARAAFPEAALQIDPIVNGLSALSRTGAPVTITLTQGRMSVGLIPLGELPPL